MMEAVNEFVSINHTRQSLMTMSTGPDKPVLLIVHGGAGCPDRPLVQKYNEELADIIPSSAGISAAAASAMRAARLPSTVCCRT